MARKPQGFGARWNVQWEWNVLGSRQPDQGLQWRSPSNCSREAESWEWLTDHLQREGEGEKEWNGFEVCLGKAVSGWVRVPMSKQLSGLSSDLGSEGLLGDKGLDFWCPGPVSLQEDLLSHYKRCLIKQAERTTLCFGFCHFQVKSSILGSSRACSLLSLWVLHSGRKRPQWKLMFKVSRSGGEENDFLSWFFGPLAKSFDGCTGICDVASVEPSLTQVLFGTFPLYSLSIVWKAI